MTDDKIEIPDEEYRFAEDEWLEKAAALFGIPHPSTLTSDTTRRVPEEQK